MVLFEPHLRQPGWAQVSWSVAQPGKISTFGMFHRRVWRIRVSSSSLSRRKMWTHLKYEGSPASSTTTSLIARPELLFMKREKKLLLTIPKMILASTYFNWVINVSMLTLIIRSKCKLFHPLPNLTFFFECQCTLSKFTLNKQSACHTEYIRKNCTVLFCK